MRALLEVRSGHLASRRWLLPKGQSLRVGGSPAADFVILQDQRIAPLHFAIEWDGTVCRLQALPNASAVLCDGEARTTAELRDGALLRAGETWFSIWLRHSIPETETSRLPGPLLAHLEQELRKGPGSLYALLDAAREEAVLKLLRASDEEFQSLYEGLQGQSLAEHAPYLVRLTSESVFLSALLRAGWGQSWGFFVTSDRSFSEVRRHFRRFLFIRDDQDRELYFRFYDPRVLRVFLPSCSPLQAEALFESTGAFIVEGERTRTWIRLTYEARHVRQQTMLFGPSQG
jgi:hypothetical protein